MSRSIFVVLLVLVAPFRAQSEPEGRYVAWLVCPGGELHFGLSFSELNGRFSASIHNGSEAIGVAAGLMDAGAWRIEFPHYDSAIEFRVLPTGSLEGRWRKQTSGQRFVELPFRARRAMPETPAQDAELETTRYESRFSSSPDEPAVLELHQRSDNALQGTFLTTTGDYRYLAGRWEGDAFELSCFDGAHAFLFRGRRGDDGGLEGDFWSGDRWHETWTARPSPTAALPDAFSLTRLSGGEDVDVLSFPDLDGRVRGLGDADFAGRARLVVIFGSWCPNCHDLTDYLVELRRRYAGLGLQVVGLAFELTDDPARNARQVRRYLERHAADWPVLLAGPADKARATEALGFLDRIRSYPTTLFCAADGRVQAIHQGFCGPATGPAHEKLRAAFEARIEALLAMPPLPSPGSLNVMTWNLRYAASRGPNAWAGRRSGMIELIHAWQPEILATQECLPIQRSDLLKALPGYECVGEGRDGDGRGEMMAVFYRRDRFQLLAQEHYWLSETPMRPGSKSFDAACCRMVTRLRLEERSTGRVLELWNTHFDHESARARHA
ncbi:MAG: redoxin family protein, partial [Planctomycetes bacterium]|nr:redoxin family protein [Planctomycetota bacterium]